MLGCIIALNNRTATSIGMAPFFIIHGYYISPIKVKEPLRTIGVSPSARAEQFISRLKEATELAQAIIALLQERQERSTNIHRKPAEQYRINDKVWLRLKNIKTDHPKKKLDWVNAKYTMLKLIGSHAYRLDTPPGIYNIFYIILLKRAAEDPLPS